MTKNLEVKIFETKELRGDYWPGVPLCAGSLYYARLDNDELIEIAAQGQMSQWGCGNLESLNGAAFRVEQRAPQDL